MSKSKISIIIAREFAIRVKKKSFIFTTILIPIFFAALIVAPILITTYKATEEELEILVVDKSGIVMPFLTSDENVKFIEVKDKTLEEIKADFNKLNVYGAIEVPGVDSSISDVSIKTFSQKQMSLDVQGRIRRGVREAFKQEKMKAYNIPNLNNINEAIETDVNLNTFQIDQNGQEKVSKVEISMAIGYFASFMIYLFIFMFGSMVLRSVIEEKTSRVIEVIVSSVKPFQLMMGKILGVAAVAILQFLIWLVLTGTIVIVANSFIGTDLIQQEGLQTQVTEQMGTSATGANIAPPINEIKDSSIFEAIKEINYIQIIMCFIIYFILGYLLYSSLFAAVGASVDNETDTQQLILPITMPLIIGILLITHTFQYPDSSLSFWGSIIPFTSPIVMMARIAYDVPLWELILSIGLLLVTFLVLSYVSSKIYRVGILMYGKKTSWKDIWRWLKY